METKICNQCNKEKTLKSFAKNRTSTKKQYHRAKCNTCRNKNQKTGLYYVYYLPNENYCGIKTFEKAYNISRQICSLRSMYFANCSGVPSAILGSSYRTGIRAAAVGINGQF